MLNWLLFSPYTMLVACFFNGVCGGLIFAYLVGEHEKERQ